MRRLWTLAALLATTALADDGNPRGWTSGGTVAVDSARIISGVDERPVLAFPRALTDRLSGPTVLFYFSPNCPHCQRVAAEVQALSVRLADHRAIVLGVASGSSSPSDLAAFQTAYGVTFDIVVDTDNEIGSAMSIRSTPAAMLVTPKGKGRLEVHDLWYPYYAGWDALIEGRVRGDVWAAFRPGAYLGNNLCGACHGQEHQAWSLTHHAVAWRTLVDDDKQGDPKCTRCHVTGAGQPGGWDGNAESRLVDVGCEACHGPGGPHDGTTTEATSTCAACHDEDHSIAFSVDKGLPLIDHFSGVGQSEDQLRERKRQLFSGEAPRALLAFPSGKNVGSAACKECHEVEHAWWSSSPHARGMDSLRTEGSDNPACVRCHATATTSGPAPDRMDGYRTPEGVGCESCHGPGEAHVASKSASDIEGLGDDCPVCVIEAVCAGCHTARWSPDWNLDERLERVAHTLPTP